MTLSSMTTDELILFYYFLLENEKYTSIKNLKYAIKNRIVDTMIIDTKI